MKNQAFQQPARGALRAPKRYAQAPLPGFGSFKRCLGGQQKRQDGKGYKKSNPKVARPFSPKLAQHVVLKSSQAKGKHSFLLHTRKIERILSRHAERLHIKLYNVATAGNHLHLFFKARTQASFRAFMRTISGLIVRAVTGAERGSPRRIAANSQHGVYTSRQGIGANRQDVWASRPGVGPNKQGQRQAQSFRQVPASFWDARPFSRIVTNGPDFINVKKYLVLNSTETGLGMNRVAVRAMLREAYAFLKTPNLVSTGFV